MSTATESFTQRPISAAGYERRDGSAHDSGPIPGAHRDAYCGRVPYSSPPSDIVSAIAVVTLLAPSLVAQLAGRPFVAQAAFLLGGLLALYVLRVRRHHGIVLFGSGQRLRQLRADLRDSKLTTHHVVAVVDDGCPQAAEELVQAVADLKPDRVVVAMAERRGRLPLKTLIDLRARGVRVTDSLEFSELLTGTIPIEALTPSSLIFATEFHKSRWTLGVIRAANLVGAALALVALAPLFALVALAIKLDSKGPVFFVHRRLGRHGEPFSLVKFRTMTEDTGARSEWEEDNRGRITRVGAILRKFRVDELPQFLNVVAGDMNLVGPRPHPVTNHQLFLDQIPFYPLRCAIRPGITGWAQIKYGYANNLEEEFEKMRFDLYYVKHMSLLLDARIIVDTIVTVVLGRNGRVATEHETKPVERPHRISTSLPQSA